MTITAPGAVGPPIICGNNKGYHSKYNIQVIFSKRCRRTHDKTQDKFLQFFQINIFHSKKLITVILDTHEQCHKVNFNIGGSTSTTRVWEIRITQYSCGSEDLAGNIKHALEQSDLAILNSSVYLL